MKIVGCDLHTRYQQNTRYRPCRQLAGSVHHGDEPVRYHRRFQTYSIASDNRPLRTLSRPAGAQRGLPTSWRFTIICARIEVIS